MKIKHLKELINKYPDDLEVVILYKDNYLEHIEDEFSIFKSSVNHCNYTTKFQSNIDYYSFTEETFVYADQIDGKMRDVQIPMQKKEVLILEI